MWIRLQIDLRVVLEMLNYLKRLLVNKKANYILLMLTLDQYMSTYLQPMQNTIASKNLHFWIAENQFVSAKIQ